MRRAAQIEKLQKTLRSLNLDKNTLDAKRALAHETARFLIASRDLMNAHFLARPVYREDIVSDGLHFFEDKQGFYGVSLFFPHLEVKEAKRSPAFIQINSEKDYDGSDGDELQSLTEGLDASLSVNGLCKVLLMLATYWRECEAEGRKAAGLREPVAKMAQALRERLRAAPSTDDTSPGVLPRQRKPRARRTHERVHRATRVQ
jgi:hypothetical protein